MVVESEIIYFFPTGGFMNWGEEPPIWPIGMEALRRPGEQRGFGMELTDEKKDLNNCLGGYLFRFWHTPTVSMKIWNETKGGSILFPYDPMTEKVRNMRKYRIYSKASLQKVYKMDGDLRISFKKVQEALAAVCCTFVEKLPFAYTDKEVVYINELFRKMYPGNFS